MFIVLKATMTRALVAAEAEFQLAADELRAHHDEIRAMLFRARRRATAQGERAHLAECQLGDMRRRAELAESRYAGLVDRMLNPHAPPPHSPIDPEVASLAPLGDDTVERMAEQFMRDGLSPDVARRHAAEVVKSADRMFGGAE